MEYTVRGLSKLSGVSERALRYYDSLGLLCPERLPNGYRRYGSSEVARLQQILFYRQMGIPLKEIALLLDDPEFDRAAALLCHRQSLCRKLTALEKLIGNIDRTLQEWKGGEKMSDQERFAGLGKAAVEKNEQAYGREIRQKYGDKALDQSNAALSKLNKTQYDAIMQEGEAITASIAACMPQGADAQETQAAIARHYAYLNAHFGIHYTYEMYAGLGQMYACDPRFTAYYERFAPGLAAFMQQAIAIFVQEAGAKAE
ncbi:Multidrug transporter activation protein [uncultured Clostridium sp.]|nr:Multidrug transporter activation protein [uncultured Clostridium sp.]